MAVVLRRQPVSFPSLNPTSSPELQHESIFVASFNNNGSDSFIPTLNHQVGMHRRCKAFVLTEACKLTNHAILVNRHDYYPTDVRVRGTARLVDNQFVSLASFKSTMTMGSFTTDFENLLLGGELSDLVNHIIGDMIPFIVRNQQREVTAAVERIVLERVNEALAGMRLEELISRIMEFL